MGPVTEQSEHLSSAQIENYGNRTSGAGPEAAQRDEHQRLDHQGSDDQRVNDQRIHDRQINDQGIHDRKIDDLKISDLKIDDQQMNDQHVEAHLADCASCRNRLLEFHRSLFASPVNPLKPDRPNADKPNADQLKNDPPEHDTSLSGHSLSGHSLSGHSSSGHSSSGQRPADSRLEGASPTDSALADSKFANPKYPVQAQVRTAPTPECPSDDSLRELAAGLTSEDVAPKLTQHAATCNHCGPLLRTYTEIFSDDFTPEEQAALANLQSSSAEWQKDTARQMLEAASGTAIKTSTDAADTRAANKESSQQKSFKGSTATTSGRKPFFWKWALVPATAAMAALAVFGIWYTQRDTPEKAEMLLVQAFTERRTMEMRWPGAEHSEIKTNRGPSDNTPPLPLLEAKQMIDKHEPQQRWALETAGLAILENRPNSAIDILSPLSSAQPACARCALLLAIAHALQGDKTGSTTDYETALNLLNSIPSDSPDKNVAIYNRALVFERLHRSNEAIADWQTIATTEKKSGWIIEAQQRLNSLRTSGFSSPKE